MAKFEGNSLRASPSRARLGRIGLKPSLTFLLLVILTRAVCSSHPRPKGSQLYDLLCLLRFSLVTVSAIPD